MAEKAKKKTKEAQQRDELLRAATEVADMWMEFRKFVRSAFGNKPINRDDEQAFLGLKSNLARLQRILGQRLPEGFHFGSRGMSELMGQSISMNTLRDLPLADKKGIYSRWHDAHIKIQHLLGILDLMAEGHNVVFETVKAKTGNLKQDIGLTGGKKKKKMSKGAVFATILAVAVVVVVVYYMMNS
jgi:hypothetical protein